MTPGELRSNIEVLLAIGIKPTVPIMRPLVEAFYDLPGNGAGGACHIVLDDGNCEDSSVDFCIGYAHESGDEMGELMARALRRCSYTQRRKLYDRPRT